MTSTVTFMVPGETDPVDPSTVTLKYANAGTTTTWEYGGTGAITKVSTGVYQAELDTTASSGVWTVEWIGTGACAVVNALTFVVTAPPL